MIRSRMRASAHSDFASQRGGVWHLRRRKIENCASIGLDHIAEWNAIETCQERAMLDDMVGDGQSDIGVRFRQSSTSVVPAVVASQELVLIPVQAAASIRNVP